MEEGLGEGERFSKYKPLPVIPAQAGIQHPCPENNYVFSNMSSSPFDKEPALSKAEGELREGFSSPVIPAQAGIQSHPQSLTFYLWL